MKSDKNAPLPPYPKVVIILPPKIWEARDQPQPDSLSSSIQIISEPIKNRS